MSNRVTTLEFAKIDKEIAELDEQLKGFQMLAQRRNDLLALKAMAERLFGTNPNGQQAQAAHTNGNGSTPILTAPDTNAGFAYKAVKAAKRPLDIDTLMALMRADGWRCSGEDGKDRKRIYAAIYNHPDFRRDSSGNWLLKVP